jgi:gamma-glutamyltranspeptidase
MKADAVQSSRVITVEAFHPFDGRVLVSALSRNRTLPHVQVSSAAMVRGSMKGAAVTWSVTPYGARKLADVLRRAARIAERGFATARELSAIAGEDE